MTGTPREREAREQAERERRAKAEQDARQNARSSRRGSADEEDAARLGVRSSVTKDELKKAWCYKMQKPPDRYPEADRAKQEGIAKHINAAYQRMLKRRAWR